MHAYRKKKKANVEKALIDKKKDKYVEIEIQEREAIETQSYGQTERESDRQADRWID